MRLESSRWRYRLSCYVCCSTAIFSVWVTIAACVWMFGRIIGRMKHAGVIFGVMLVFLFFKIGGSVYFESAPTQAFAALPVMENVGNLEGKELRLGATTGPLWAVLTTSEVAAAFTSAATLLGVAQLGYPGQLVEVDVTAVLPA